MEHNKRASVTIHTAIILLSLVLITGVAVSIMLIYQNRYEKSLHEMTDQIIMKSADNVKENAATSLGLAVRASSVISAIFSQHEGIRNNKTEYMRTLTTMLSGMPKVYSMYYGDEEGNFLLVGKKRDAAGSMHFFTKEVYRENGRRISTESWLDNDGRVVSTRDITEFDRYNPRIRPWYVRAVEKGKATWSDPYVFYVTGEPGITYASPVYMKGRLVGVCGVDLEIKGISFTKLSAYTPNTKFFMLDKMGRVLAHSDIGKYLSEMPDRRIPEFTELDDRVMTKMTTDYSSGGANIEIKDYELFGTEYKTVMRSANIEGMELIVGIYTPFDDYLGAVNKANREILILSVCVIIISIFISVRISAAITRPFIILSQATDSISTYDFNNQIKIKTRFPEAQKLVKNFNKMVISLDNYRIQNDILNKNLESAYLDTLYRLALAAEYKDHFTAEHLNRVSMISAFIADVLGMSRHDIELIKHASAMHDVGKIGIPDEILTKPGRLTEDEFEVIKLHTVIGEKMLKDPSSEIMETARIVALSHHERWNGLGYPFGLKGRDIPLFGRIVSVADVMDALISRRSYKDAFSFDKTLDIMISEKGEQFQPEFVELVVEHRRHIETIIYNPI